MDPNSKKESKEKKHHHHHHHMGSSNSKGTTPVAPIPGHDFPTTATSNSSSSSSSSSSASSAAKSCVIVLIQDARSFPAPPNPSRSVNSDDDASSTTATTTTSPSQIYEKWKQQVVEACRISSTAVHPVDVPKLLLNVATMADEEIPKQTRETLVAEIQRLYPAAVVATHISQYPILGLVNQVCRGSCFTVMADHTVSKSGPLRLMGVDRWNVHMCSHVPRDIVHALSQVCAVPPPYERHATLECPYCSAAGLTQFELWNHCQMFHINIKDRGGNPQCPICRHVVTSAQHGNLYTHIHNAHAPPGTRSDERADIRLYSFGLCVIRRKSDGKFLVVQEYSNQGVWLPGGGIDAAELPWCGAQRECIEEAGVRVNLKGVLRVEVSPSSMQRGVRGGGAGSSGYCRMRYIFYGEPADENDCEPKTFPDFESVGACWISLEELSQTRLRGHEPAVWFKAVAEGCPIYPMSLFGLEGDDA